MAISFKSFTRGAPSGSGQNTALINALMRRSLNPQPIRHPLQGVNQMAQAALAAYLKHQGVATERAREAGIADTFREAYTAGAGSPERAIAPELADVTGGTELGPTGFRVPALAGDKQALIDILMGNPDTARFGAELGIEDLFKNPEETFAPVLDAQGNIVGQRSSTSARVFSDPRAPKDNKGFTLGEDQIRYDAAGNMIARGPETKTKLTLAQERENAEIRQARAALDREGLGHEDVMRISKSQRDTGRDNPDYSPFINSRVRQATRRKYGNDPDYAAAYGRYLTPAPEFSEPAGAKPLPPGVSAEEPGILDRVGDFLFGDDEAAAPGGPENAPRRGPRGIPRGGGRGGTRGRGGAKVIQKMSLAEIDDLINQRGDSLSPTELRAVEARLKALGL